MYNYVYMYIYIYGTSPVIYESLPSLPTDVRFFGHINPFHPLHFFHITPNQTLVTLLICPSANRLPFFTWNPQKMLVWKMICRIRRFPWATKPLPPE